MNMLYIDPAATTAVVASLAAIITAVGATAIIIWRKVKKGVFKTFHIDENANREVEEDVVIFNENNESAEEKVSDEAETVTK